MFGAAQRFVTCSSPFGPAGKRAIRQFNLSQPLRSASLRVIYTSEGRGPQGRRVQPAGLEEFPMRSTLFRATALAAGLAVALVGAPAVSAPLAGAAPVAAAVQKADAGFETVAWRHHYHRHHGFGPGALFAGAALGLIGASIAGAFSGPDYYDYGYPYCDPYDPYTACYSYGPSYVYGGGLPVLASSSWLLQPRLLARTQLRPGQPAGLRRLP